MTYMNDESLRKKEFVESELQAMLHAATGGYVSACEYERIGAYEVVHVTLHPDQWTTEMLDANVTADSRWAIAKDVMKAVAERFE